jgi:hypothetical protein
VAEITDQLKKEHQPLLTSLASLDEFTPSRHQNGKQSDI